MSEPAQDVDRRVAHRRKTICQLGARLRFDLLDQNPEHVVEQADVLVVVAAGSIEKERGDALEHLHALLPGAVLDDLFEFGDQREAGTHFPIHEIRRMARCPRPR
jgi:hypothetical protein